MQNKMYISLKCEKSSKSVKNTAKNQKNIKSLQKNKKLFKKVLTQSKKE